MSKQNHYVNADLLRSAREKARKLWSSNLPCINDIVQAPKDLDEVLFANEQERRKNHGLRNGIENEMTHCYGEFGVAYEEYAKIDCKDYHKGTTTRPQFDHLLMVMGQLFFYTDQYRRLFTGHIFENDDKQKEFEKPLVEMKARLNMACAKYDIPIDVAKKSAALYSFSTDVRRRWTRERMYQF